MRKECRSCFMGCDLQRETHMCGSVGPEREIFTGRHCMPGMIIEKMLALAPSNGLKQKWSSLTAQSQPWHSGTISDLTLFPYVWSPNMAKYFRKLVLRRTFSSAGKTILLRLYPITEKRWKVRIHFSQIKNCGLRKISEARSFLTKENL